MSQLAGSCSESVIHQEAVARATEAMLAPEVTQDAVRFFKLMGDMTRFSILWALSREELCVCDLGVTLNMSKSAVSHQLASLRRGKLVRSRREGKVVYYSIADEHVGMMLKQCVEHASEDKAIELRPRL